MTYIQYQRQKRFIKQVFLRKTGLPIKHLDEVEVYALVDLSLLCAVSALFCALLSRCTDFFSLKQTCVSFYRATTENQPHLCNLLQPTDLPKNYFYAPM